jgi:hypothetical protein
MNIRSLVCRSDHQESHGRSQQIIPPPASKPTKRPSAQRSIRQNTRRQDGWISLGVTLQQVLTDKIWRDVAKRARSAPSRKAAIAYVTTNDVGLRAGDVLIADASVRAIRSGQTDARLLRKLHDAGVIIYCREGLHSKVALFGKHAVVGSANMSGSDLIEASVITDSAIIVSGVAAFIENRSALRDRSEANGFQGREARVESGNTIGKCDLDPRRARVEGGSEREPAEAHRPQNKGVERETGDGGGRFRLDRMGQEIPLRSRVSRRRQSSAYTIGGTASLAW